MANPPDPLVPPGPFDGSDPLDDPMLDELERSILHPPGFGDPLVRPGDDFVDETARMLDMLEASIEGGLPVHPVEGGQPMEGPGAPLGDPLVDGAGGMRDPLGGETDPAQPALPDEEGLDNADAPATSPSSVRRRKRGTSEESPADPTSALRPEASRGRSYHAMSGGGSRRQGPAESQASQGGRPGVPGPVRGLGRASAGTKGSRKRQCPETRDVVDVGACDSCDLYRHWPDGSDAEPHECWHDWKARQAVEEDDGDDD